MRPRRFAVHPGLRLFLPSLLAAAAVGCASTKPLPVFQPQEEQNILPYFVRGVPYAHIDHDCTELVCSMTPVLFGDATYMAVYLQITNRSEGAFLVHPLEDVALQVLAVDDTARYLPPRSPTAILATIKNTKTAAMVAHAFAGALEAAAVQPTRVTGPRTTWTISDTESKRQAVADRTAVAMAGAAARGTALEVAVDSQILRRNTVFPDETVDGFVYFPLELSGSGGGAITKAAESTYRLRIDTPCGPVDVHFTSAPGE